MLSDLNTRRSVPHSSRQRTNEGSARRGGAVIKVVGVMAICSLIAFFFMSSDQEGAGSKEDAVEVLVHEIQRDDFVSIVTESGDIESASNVEVRCEVESVGAGSGTTILEIVEEGTLVKEGDFLLQFDDAALQLALTQQEIVVATDHAAVVESQSELNKAEQALKEYQEGTFLAEKETLVSALLQSEIHLQSAEDALGHTERMFRKGYVSPLQLKSEEKSVEMARKAVQVAQINLKVLEGFTFDKMVGELKAEVEKQKAYLAAAQFTEKLSKQRRDEILEQIRNCRVVAPTDGQVIYANDYKRRDAVLIEEGAQIREGQVVIRLPDPTQMQVAMRINDSKINLVREGNRAKIVLDVDPKLPVQGELHQIAPFPLPREWKGGPIEYEAAVRVLNPPPRLQSGQRAKVSIYVERQEDVIQAPIQSVVGREDNHYCLVKDDQGNWDLQQVVVGLSNDSYVVVQSGLNEGDRVALNPDLIWDHVAGDLPALPDKKGGTKVAPSAGKKNAPSKKKKRRVEAIGG